MALYIGDTLIAGSFKAGASWEVGDVGISAFGIDEALNKRRYLNGQVISQAQFVEFTAMLKSRVSVYPNLATTEVNWQAEVTNSKLGQCGKFVIDDTAGTIRLPKVVNINGLQDLTVLGGIKAESLPNITGGYYQPNTAAGGFAGVTYGVGATGAFHQLNGVSGKYSAAQGDTTVGLGFDASLSSSTYQDDAPVQQEAIQYPYFIQVATGVETSIDVSREIELNNPFSLLDYKYSEYELSNASWLLSNGQWNSGAVYQSVYDLLLQIYNETVTKAGVSVKLSTETYADTDFVLNTSDTTFRLPIKVLMAGSKRVAGNGMTLGLNDGTNNFGVGTTNTTTGTPWRSALYGADIGTSVSGGALTNSLGAGITTDETKSGIETSANGLYLYFYVGEVVQDANIIAAASVLTKVANSIDRTVISDRETVIGWDVPDFESEVSIANTTGGFVYTTPSNGYIKLNKGGANTVADCFLYKGNSENGTLIASNITNRTAGTASGYNASFEFQMIRVENGQQYYFKTSNVNMLRISFVPCKGV